MNWVKRGEDRTGAYDSPSSIGIFLRFSSLHFIAFPSHLIHMEHCTITRRQRWVVKVRTWEQRWKGNQWKESDLGSVRSVPSLSLLFVHLVVRAERTNKQGNNRKERGKWTIRTSNNKTPYVSLCSTWLSCSYCSFLLFAIFAHLLPSLPISYI